MIKIKGKYNTAHVFTDYVDPESYKGILSFLNSKAAVGSRVRIMPDFHAGAGCVIGTTATIKDYVIPNVVGVDISCGVLAFEFNKPNLDLKAVDAFIHSNIPSGGGQVNKTPFESRLMTWPLSRSTKEFSETLEDLCKTVGCNYDYISASLGSLGGGR